jgi:ribA/ribD-fused uncharacterized protein
MDTIAFTKVALPFGWLGNMAPYPVQYDGKEWRTTEALFQALRFDNDEVRELIRAEKSPMGAKMRTKALSKIHTKAIQPMSQEDIDLMEMCLRLKVAQHREIQRKLRCTRDQVIIEDCTARGKRGTNLFWGAVYENGEWVGENVLGKLWMKIRSEL